MYGVESETCLSKKTGKPLKEYASQECAQEAANYANEEYGNNLAPYQCGKCDLWHLSPKDRQTPSRECDYCTDENGNNKQLYKTEADARTRADIIYKEEGIELHIYSCEYTDGWHLTKQSY